MEFSEEWKSLWTVGSVFPAPLLLTGPSAEPLGPLLFHPAGSPVPLLCSRAFTTENVPTSRPGTFSDSVNELYKGMTDTFTPRSILTDVAMEDMLQTGRDGFHDRFSGDNLQSLKCRNGEILLFFLTGENSDRIGCVFLSTTGSDQPKARAVKEGKIFQLSRCFNHRILQIAVNSRDFSSSVIGTPATEGLLLVFTCYCVHWFRVELRFSEPFLLHLATANFRFPVSHACWSPHLPEESAVVLNNGELRLYDLSSCYGVSRLPAKLRREMISRDLCSLVSKDSERGWWVCEFGWHPRIFIVACASTVFLIDLRFDKNGIVSILANLEFCESLNGLQSDRFVAFGKGVFDHFHFSIATSSLLLLLDTRQPLTPIVQWNHSLDHLDRIRMFKLSDLRPLAGKFKWASDSGFSILAGSFRKCEFSLFCYGPLPQDSPDSSVVSKQKFLLCENSEFHNSLYAWELPSELTLLGYNCPCGDCILRDEFSMDNSPYPLPLGHDPLQKKENVLGFCILTEDHSAQNSPSGLVSPENDCFGGFHLIKLLSSQKIESQMYRASFDFPSTKYNPEETKLRSEDYFLSSGCQEDTIRTKFAYFDLEYLSSYLKGGTNLANALVLNMGKTPIKHEQSGGKSVKLSYVKAPQELTYDMLKVAGVKKIGSFPAIVDVVKGINFPTSISEIVHRRIWTGLLLDLLQLAFVKNADLFNEETDVPLEFLDVPSYSHAQQPPFFTRKPSMRSAKLLSRASKSHALVGPVLPLPILLIFQQMCKEKVGLDGLPTELELDVQCREIGRVIGDLVSRESRPNVDEPVVISIAEDYGKWVDFQDPQDEPLLFFHEPQVNYHTSLTCNMKNNAHGTKDPVQITQAPSSTCITDDNKFGTIVSRLRKQEPVPDGEHQQVGVELFNDLSPVKLHFGASNMKFAPEELQIYKCLRRQFSKWQEGFEPYGQFYRSSTNGGTQ